MAKDKMLQQASWEKKKDKLDKKQQSERGTARKIEKEKERKQKEDRIREQKEAKMCDSSGVYFKLYSAGSIVVAMLVILYAVAMKSQVLRDRWGEETTMVLTTFLVVCLSFVVVVIRWQFNMAKAEEQQLTGIVIKEQLERKLTEKERAESASARRVLQLKEAQELMRRRVQEEAAAMQRAKELARACRLRREEREAEEARAARAAAAKASSGAAEEIDTHGWTAKQRQQLRDAALRYPEGWSHAKKKRWEMIASEVGGHDARACEAAHARLEAEMREVASQAKAAGRKEQKDAGASSSSALLGHDHDWMVDGGEGDTTLCEDSCDAASDAEDDDEDEEEEENDAHRERMAVEVDPVHKGTEIQLDGIKAMQGCASVQVEVLHVQITCVDCRTTTRVFLSGADEELSSAKAWCEWCSGLISVQLRPTLLHRASSRLCYVDCVRCSVTDVLPSVLMSVCEVCDMPNVHKQEFGRNRIISGACFACHSKYSFGAESIRIEQVTPCERGSAGSDGRRSVPSKDAEDPMEEIAEELRYLRKKAKSDPRELLIKLGSPLPQMGACSHFKKSFKWFRFACCGRAFPCPQCHADSGCPAASLGAQAPRMICGKCSMEQSYAPRPCEKCGFAMQARGSAHWDDGCGTRNLCTMSAKDAKKFKGGVKQANSKTKTSSNKAERVGAKAKAQREHIKKFGKEV